jgi:hypothetical protein
MELLFTIRGNQEDPYGNPIPYFRVTSQSKFSKGAKRYNEWKTFVVAHYLDIMRTFPADTKREQFGDIHDLLERAPITLAPGETAVMDIKILWANKKHADCDNIYKGIADALFKDDKYITHGSFSSGYADSKAGSVEVRIITNK